MPPMLPHLTIALGKEPPGEQTPAAPADCWPVKPCSEIVAARPRIIRCGMRYRREIDGLRAVAVLPVILFHAGFQIFSGGYVGVDVFFVISGYLITGIIIAEHEGGNFSIVRFYERRVRRILPALFLVMLCCIPVAWVWMLPSQFKDFSKSLIAVTAFASNILFWTETGYFASAADEKPLLHTWSLAVEEQYYVFFPIFLIIMWRFGRNQVVYVTATIALFSLLLCEWAWRHSPAGNFFLTPTRVWELLGGSLCAFLLHNKTRASNDLFAAIGLLLILFAIFHFDSSTPYPSFNTLAPVGGTALIILYGSQGTWVARFLSAKPLVAIGLISYSAYLWHQPLFAFARVRIATEPQQWVMVTLAAASIGLAFLSWRYVEQPFRKRPQPILPRGATIFAAAAAAAGCAFAFGAFGYLSDGATQRFSDQALLAVDLKPNDADACIAGFAEQTASPCYYGDTDSDFEIAVIGDSHAGQWMPAFHQIGLQNGWKISLLAKSACPAPKVSLFYDRIKRQYYECDDWRNSVYSHLNANRPDAIVMTSSSIGYVKYNKLHPISIEEWSEGLRRSLSFFSDFRIPVIWLADNPQPKEMNPYLCVQRAILINDRNPAFCRSKLKEVVDQHLLDSEKRVVNSFAGANFLDFTDFFCDDVYCSAYIDNIIIYKDNNHITYETALHLKERLARALKEIFREGLWGAVAPGLSAG